MSATAGVHDMCKSGIGHSYARLRAAFATAALLAFAGAAQAASLRERLTPDVLAVVMPGAERLGTEEGSPPASSTRWARCGG